MPWPDVPVALKQGVITGLDHTPMVCNITKKFEVAKYFTYVNYAQGLFIWIFNKGWYNSLPEDLRKTFTEVVHDVCADIRTQTKQQELDEIAKAKANGIEFITLSDSDQAMLRKLGDAVHQEYAAEINKLYPSDKYKFDNYLKDVQDYMVHHIPVHQTKHWQGLPDLSEIQPVAGEFESLVHTRYHALDPPCEVVPVIHSLQQPYVSRKQSLAIHPIGNNRGIVALPCCPQKSPFLPKTIP